MAIQNPRKPVEEAAAQDVGADEPPGRPEKAVEQRPAAALGQLAFQILVAEDRDFAEVGIDVWKRIVMQVGAHQLDGSTDFEEVMLRRPSPAGAFTADEAELAVGIPVPMLDPASEKENLPRKRCSGKSPGVAAMEESQDFPAQVRREFLIGVEGEDPPLGAEFEGRVFLIAIPQPVLVDKARATLTRAIRSVPSVEPLSMTMTSVPGPPPRPGNAGDCPPRFW